jgi:uncharacterized membrane protein YbhN (UPF0104 family)
VLLGFGSCLFIYLLFRLGVAEITSLLLRTGWSFSLVVAIYTAYELIRAAAYGKCVPAQESPSYWEMVRIRFSGDAIQFLTSTGPFLAEPAKVWLLGRLGLDTKHAVAATVLEYLIYTFTSAVFAVAGLAYLLTHFELAGPARSAAWLIVCLITIFLLAAAYAIIFRIYLIGAILKAAGGLPLIGKKLRYPESDVRATEDLLFAILRDNPSRFFLIWALESVAQALLVLELFVLLRAVGLLRNAIHPFLIEGATKFIGLAFFFIPGQVGAAEGVYALIFNALGLPAFAGFSLAVARRLRSLLAAAVGLILAPGWSDLRDGVRH